MPRHGALTTEKHFMETSMNLKTITPTKAMCLVPLTALWLASAPDRHVEWPEVVCDAFPLDVGVLALPFGPGRR